MYTSFTAQAVTTEKGWHPVFTIYIYNPGLEYEQDKGDQQLQRTKQASYGGKSWLERWIDESFIIE